MGKGSIGFMRWLLLFGFSAAINLPCFSEGKQEIPLKPETAKLIERLKAWDDTAISKLEDSGDKAAIPFIKKCLKEYPDKDMQNVNNAACRMQIALAKLGDEETLRVIHKELESEATSEYKAAMEKLVKIGGNASTRTLAKYLYDENFKCLPAQGRNAKGEIVKSLDYFTTPRSMVVMAMLAKLIPNHPPLFTGFEGDKNRKELVMKWRKWWEANKSKYEKD